MPSPVFSWVHDRWSQDESEVEETLTDGDVPPLVEIRLGRLFQQKNRPSVIFANNENVAQSSDSSVP